MRSKPATLLAGRHVLTDLRRRHLFPVKAQMGVSRLEEETWHTEVNVQRTREFIWFPDN